MPPSPVRPPVGSLVAVFVVSAVAFGSVGCGHPASRDECEQIFNRNAEVELLAQNVKDPGTVAKRTSEARAAKGDEFFAQCVGKRITSRAVACVTKASTASELDRCLE